MDRIEKEKIILVKRKIDSTGGEIVKRKTVSEKKRKRGKMTSFSEKILSQKTKF